MKLEAIAPGQNGAAARFDPREQLAQQRRKTQEDVSEPTSSKNQISSEELLEKINELSQDGLYSVRFEQHEASKNLVIRVVDRNSGDIIRQIPSEEFLEISQHLKDLRGSMIDMAG